MKNNPQIVYDFFGKEWVRHFNGKAKLKFITEKRKLDANGVLTYRKELHKFYSVLFNNHDTGIAIQELKGHSFQLQERFIIPDAIEKNSIDSYSLSFKEKPENNYEEYQDLFDESFPNSYASQNISQEIRRRQKDETKNTSEIRARIDTLLTKNRKSIVLGDPGSGKSTLLRNLVLDILSEKPKFSIFAQNWGSYLPIWLPFAFITKNLAENNNLSIAELLNIWLRSYDKEHLYDIVKNALEDERLLLIIDGIDESTDISSAQHAISKIDIHSVLNKTCIVYSSRPFGYKLLKDSLQKTREIYLQPFSKEQQKQYILYWYERWIESINNNDFDYARTQTIKFLDELSRSSELSIIAENPLLLSILVTQKLRDSVLPSNRLKALETITEYLIDVHPKKRASSANIIENEKFNSDIIED